MKKILKVKDWVSGPHFRTVISDQFHAMIQVQRIRDGELFKVGNYSNYVGTLGILMDSSGQLTASIDSFNNDMIHATFVVHGFSDKCLGIFKWPLNDFELIRNNTALLEKFRERNGTEI